jgi:hypothetical protein
VVPLNMMTSTTLMLAYCWKTGTCNIGSPCHGVRARRIYSHRTCNSLSTSHASNLDTISSQCLTPTGGPPAQPQTRARARAYERVFLSVSSKEKPRGSEKRQRSKHSNGCGLRDSVLFANMELFVVNGHSKIRSTSM